MGGGPGEPWGLPVLGAPAGPALYTHRSWPSSVGEGKARSSRPMLMSTWLVSGQTWGTGAGFRMRRAPLGAAVAAHLPRGAHL